MLNNYYIKIDLEKERKRNQIPKNNFQNDLKSILTIKTNCV